MAKVNKTVMVIEERDKWRKREKELEEKLSENQEEKEELQKKAKELKQRIKECENVIRFARASKLDRGRTTQGANEHILR